MENKQKQFKEDLLREHNRKLENSAQENKDLSIKLTSLTTTLEKTQTENVNLLNQQKEAEKNRDLEVAKKVSEAMKSKVQVEIRKDIEEDTMKRVRAEEAERYSRDLSIQATENKQLKKQIADLQRYGSSHSQQVQGQSQSWVGDCLKKEFLDDQLEEFKRGMNGPDFLQTIVVNNRPISKIVWDAKDTKSFENKWIHKIKRECETFKASDAVICTTALPPSITEKNEKWGVVEGVYVIHPELLIYTTYTLRLMSKEVNRYRILKENQASQADKVYSYFTSDDFKHRIMGIAEFYKRNQEILHKETYFLNSMSKKEKLNEDLYASLLSLRGDFEGISAGNQIKAIDGLDTALLLK